MKYRLKPGERPRNLVWGSNTYLFNERDYREYPESVIEVMKDVLVSDEPVKPKKKETTEISEENNG
jgi:hypothetical protein